MPNWCGNRLSVAGDLSLLAELQSAMAGTDEDGRPKVISFQSISPQPTEPLVDGETWRCAHWGTKWDALTDSMWVDDEAEDGKFVVYFWTAWDPPAAAVQLLASRFPDLDFELVYNESGMGLAGYRMWENGRQTDYDEVHEPEDAVALLRRFDWESEASEWLYYLDGEDEDDDETVMPANTPEPEVTSQRTE